MDAESKYFRVDRAFERNGSQEPVPSEMEQNAIVQTICGNSTDELSQSGFLRQPFASNLQVDSAKGPNQLVLDGVKVGSGVANRTEHNISHLGVILRKCRDTELIAQDPLSTVCIVHRDLRRRFGTEMMVIRFCQQLNQLSVRELDVLLLTIEGRTLKDVSARLGVGIATIAKHRANAFKKLAVRNSTELYYLLDAVFNFLTQRHSAS